MRLYVNGVQVASQPQTGPIPFSANPLQIGGDNLLGQYFLGAIDDVRIYNGALSQSAIQTDMNTPVTSPPAWSFDFGAPGPPLPAAYNQVTEATAYPAAQGHHWPAGDV